MCYIILVGSFYKLLTIRIIIITGPLVVCVHIKSNRRLTNSKERSHLTSIETGMQIHQMNCHKEVHCNRLQSHLQICLLKEMLDWLLKLICSYLYLKCQHLESVFQNSKSPFNSNPLSAHLPLR